MAAPNPILVSVVSNRNFTLTTTLGHSVRFEKGVPKDIPREILPQAMAAGVLPSEELAPEPEDGLPKAPIDTGERQLKIRSAIEKLIARNQRGDFTAAGLPRVSQVTALVGFDVISKEVAAVMQQIYDERAE